MSETRDINGKVGYGTVRRRVVTSTASSSTNPSSPTLLY